VTNVLFENIGSPDWGTGGKLFRVTNGVADVEITHVTSTSNPNGILDPLNTADLNPNLVFAHNIVERSLYGIGAGANEGLTTLTKNFAPFVYSQNVLVNTSGATKQAIADGALKARYPKDTIVVPGWDALGFQKDTFKLAPSSRLPKAGEDGKDPGADMDAIGRAQNGPDSSGCAAPGTARRPSRNE
jgi:hypothetical protein